MLRFARNDGGAPHRKLFKCQTARRLPFGHASLPQVLRLQGSPLTFTGFFLVTAAPNRYPNLRPKGRTERRALWLPAASMHTTNLSCTSKTKKHLGAQSSSRLRSARGWVMRLAPCPRVCCCRQLAPFERTVARTCTWAVLRLTGVTPPPPFGDRSPGSVRGTMS